MGCNSSNRTDLPESDRRRVGGVACLFLRGWAGPLALVPGLLSSHAGSGRAGPGTLRFQLTAESLLLEARASLQVPCSLRLTVTGSSHRMNLNLSPTPWHVPVPSPVICINRSQQRSLWQPGVTALQPAWTLLRPLPHSWSISSGAHEAQEP